MSDPNSHVITGSKITLNSTYPFINNIPQEIMLSFNEPFKNLYIGIYNKNEVYPTLRKSTRYNRSISIFGCEINVYIKLKC
jgi:hypothetical protein